jgi:carboxyl-terminal processing protease
MKLEIMDKPKYASIKEADLAHHLTKSNSEKLKADSTKEAKTTSKESDNDYLDYPLNEALNLLKGIGILANDGHPSTL